MKGHILVEGSKELLQNPQVNQRLFRQEDVEAADLILKKSGYNRTAVESESDWQVIDMIVSFFSLRWPEEAQEFQQTLRDVKASRKPKGDSDSKEMRYLTALPIRLTKLIKAVFPFQQFDKKFMYKFLKKYPVLKVGGS